MAIKPNCENCGEEHSHRIIKETSEHWSEENQCWGANPSVSFFCGECQNEIELGEEFQ